MTRYRDIRIVFVLASLVAVLAIAHGREWTKLLTSRDIPSVSAVAFLGRSIHLFDGLCDDFATFENTFFDDRHLFYTKTNLDEALPGRRPAARTFAASAPAGTSSATAYCAPA